EIARPDLHVARQRLAVEPDIVRMRAEQDGVDVIFAFERNEILIARHALPAMTAAEFVALRAQPLVVAVVGARLVEPARLRHAYAGPLVTRNCIEQRDLHRERRYLGETTIRARAPKDEARRRRQQMQPAGEIGRANLLRQRTERTKGEEIT